ncbi:hypothetical protein NDN08_001149 [Rhodosorus marinus]|uniref:Cysteine--tRNA ligase n=1 Tax=Rhodosorus marinus TaxID=101924 RepID=A0AAV8UVQ1_9RHOD|nr:hypothetical protein NDN08_001149 [Rhodosorus marinus]
MTIAYLLPLIGSSRWGSHGQAVSERRRGRASLLVRASAVDEKHIHGEFSLYNTMTGKKEVFDRTVHEDGVVRFYSCGPTVYDSAHVGNFRAFLTYDILKRWLRYRGFDVNHVMNLTDVDDKIIKRVLREGSTLEEITEKYSKLFFDDLSLLNVIPADKYPKATEHIEEIVDLIEGLKTKGAAYESSGSTYFKVDSFSDYGKLVKLEKRESGARRTEANDTDEYDKSDARDFALWKAYKDEDGEVKWNSTLGVGRPGWHIECSCMAMKYLGPQIDIHGGGIDLVFPHHENEIAQSEAYSGKEFARFWVHNGFVNIGGEKMSKSLGNFRTLGDVVKNPDDARAFRYLVVSSQYRSTLNFTEDVLKAARNTIKRLDALRKRLADVQAEERTVEMESSSEIESIVETAKSAFLAAMNDDLNTPRAVAALFEMMSKVGKLLKAEKLDSAHARTVDDCILDFDRVLGVFYKVPTVGNVSDEDGTDGTDQVIPDALQELLVQRTEARKSKDFSLADQIRDQIAAEGYQIKDSPNGAVLIKI